MNRVEPPTAAAVPSIGTSSNRRDWLAMLPGGRGHLPRRSQRGLRIRRRRVARSVHVPRVLLALSRAPAGAGSRLQGVPAAVDSPRLPGSPARRSGGGLSRPGPRNARWWRRRRVSAGARHHEAPNRSRGLCRGVDLVHVGTRHRRLELPHVRGHRLFPAGVVAGIESLGNRRRLDGTLSRDVLGRIGAHAHPVRDLSATDLADLVVGTAGGCETLAAYRH